MAVKLRKRKYPKKGERFYLDIYINEQNRTSQFLDIWLYNSDTKVERKYKQELAN